MVAPVVAAALIGGGSSLLGGFLSGRSADKNLQRQFDFQDKWNEKQYGLDVEGLDLSKQSFEWQKSYVQNRVKDARDAGIHPLYALGAPGAGASFSAGGYGGAPTGAGGSGGLGRGIQAAGAAAATYLKDKGGAAFRALQARLVESQIGSYDASATRDIAEAQFAASKAARVGQAVNSSGVGRTFPYGENVTRGLDIQPDINAPGDVTIVLDDGTKLRGWNTDVMGEGADYMNAGLRAGKDLADQVQRVYGRKPPSKWRSAAAAEKRAKDIRKTKKRKADVRRRLRRLNPNY